MQNLNYLFNKEYYKNLGTPAFSDDVKRLNNQINSIIFQESDYSKPLTGCDTVYMKILYPGLLIGTGNPHEFGMNNIKWDAEITIPQNDRNRISLSQWSKYLANKLLSEQSYFDIIRRIMSKGTTAISDTDIEIIRNNVIGRGTVRNTVFRDNKQAKDFLINLMKACLCSDDDVKNGFSFDYTTGQPYIPGSSVKGMLRSYFKEQRNVVAEILKAITETEWTEDEIKILEKDIFENHDVFFDAVVYWGDISC